MKSKNTPWTAAEEIAFAEAVQNKISPLRLSVRLHRSEASIKRRMRELGLAGKRRGPKVSPDASGLPTDAAAIDVAAIDLAAIDLAPQIDLGAEASKWLLTCRSRDLSGLLDFYRPEATLECLCTGAAVYGGHLAIQEYWAPKLRSAHPLAFTTLSLKEDNERVVIDFLSYEARPVRMSLSFDQAGKIIHSKCGPALCSRETQSALTSLA